MPKAVQPNSDADVASSCLAKAISFAKSFDEVHAANKSAGAETNRDASKESFKPGKDGSGALFFTRADAECAEFAFEGEVYRVREQNVFAASLSQRGCSGPKRSVSSILAAQRATREASAKARTSTQVVPEIDAPIAETLIKSTSNTL